MAPTGVIGSLAPFDPSVCRFSVYVTRFRQFVLVNGIPDAKHVAAFITVLGDGHFQLLVNLMAPDDPTTKTLDEIVEVLQNHFEPATLEVAERQKFYARHQNQSESISTFVADLKRLSIHCNFGGTLDNMLRDRFVAGVRSDATKRKLLTSKDLTFDGAVEIAVQHEAADRDMSSILHYPSAGASNANSSPTVAHVQKKKFQKGPGNKSTKSPSGNQGKKSSDSSKKDSPCHRCGKLSHWAPDCPHAGDTCKSCGKKGHWSVVCRGGNSNSKVHSTSGGVGAVFQCSGRAPDAIRVAVVINSKTITMELDTGASHTILSEEHWKEVGSPPLQPTNMALRSYGGRQLHILGLVEAKVTVDHDSATVPLIVVRAPDFPSLFGRDWLAKFRLDWSALCQSLIPNTAIHAISMEQITSQYPELFSSELGRVVGVKAHVEVRPDSSPRFFKPRPVPFTLKPKIESDLERLTKLGVISPIMRSDWAAPIVPVLKPDGSIRVCGDFRLTVNPAIQADWYPLPTTEELFASLSGSTVFSKLDLSDAYLQIELEDAAKDLIVVNTHKGLYQYNRLPFGTNFSPALFQHTIEKILQGLEGVCAFLDDIFVHGKGNSQHDPRLHSVLKRLQEHGLRLKKSKCAFSMSKLDYLGHTISAAGIHPSKDKIEAISNAPKPTNSSELHTFLGLINYYGKFIQGLSTIAAPLYALLKAGVPWKWSAACEKAFSTLRDAIPSDAVLTHFDSELPVVLECDASSYGIGAALSHVFPDGSHRPIAFASKTLSAAEKNYSQIEKEALSLIFGVLKYHRFLFGRHFELVTDHKPLLMVLGPKGHIASVSASRLHRWAVILSAYDFSLRFRPTKEHANVDYLSRFPLPSITDPCLESVDSNVHFISFLDDISSPPTTYKEVRIATSKDKLLTEVMRYVQSGWPFESSCPNPALQPFFTRRHELSISGGCLLWNLRLIIPDILRTTILEALHECHSGIVRMKSIARAYVWWPGIDKSIEDISKACVACGQIQSSPAKAPLHPWSFPDRPWQRVHIDFCGPVFNQQWLILVDAHTKWPEAISFSSYPTSASLIEALRIIFARFGLPEEIVSDNGSQFTSDMFENFCISSGIRHRLSAPHHPATNGEAERFVRTFKEGLKPFSSSTDWKYEVQKFLLAYRVTPHATTGRTPSELLLGRTVRTRWDLLRPSHSDSVASAQDRQIASHGGKDRSFIVGDYTWARDYRGVEKWIPGEITEVLGPRHYRVRTSIGIWKRHIEQLRPRLLPAQTPDPSIPVSSTVPLVPLATAPAATSSPPNGDAPPMELRRSTREHRPPDRLTF